MNVWQWIGLVLAAWTVLSVVVGLGFGALIRRNEEAVDE